MLPPVRSAGAGSGNYSISQPTGLTAVISPAPLSATSSVSKTYDGTTSAILSGSNTTFGGFIGSDGATVNAGVTGTFATANVGTGIAVTGVALSAANLTATGSTLLSNYTLPATDNGSGSITAATLTYTATPSSQHYGLPPAGLGGSLRGFVNSETLATATSGAAVFSTPATGASNVGHYAIEGAGLTANNGNYVFVQAGGNATALTITQAPLTVSGVQTTSRSYDGTTVDALSGALISGVTYNNDVLTLTNTGSGTLGRNGNVGTDVVTTHMGLTGSGSGNYTLTQESGLSAVISAVGLTAATSSLTKTYDGTTTASLSGANTIFTGFVTGQGATVNAGVTGTFASANVGSGIIVTGGALTAGNLTASGSTLLSNYTLPTSDNGTGSITPAIVNLSGTRVYDADVDAIASIFGTAGTISTGVNSETLALSGSSTLVSQNVSTTRALSSLGTFALGNGTGGNGGTATNYTLIGGTDAVNVTAAMLTYNATAASQFYGVTPSGLTGTVTGFVGGELLANVTTGTAPFTTAATAASNVNHYAINGSGLTANNGNYTFTQASGNSTALTINKAIVNLTGTRTYNGLTTAAASIFGTAGTVSTGVGAQTLVLGGSGTLAAKDVGSRSVSLPGSLTLSNGTGGLASNYTLTGGTGTVTVTPATLTYTATATSQFYGVTPSGLTGTVTGFVNSETLAARTTPAPAFTTAATATSNVNHYAINGSGVTANNGDYTFVQASGNPTALNITPAVVNLSGTRVYDALLDANALIFGTAGTVSGANGETLILSGGGTLAGKNAGSQTVSALGSLAF